MAATRDLSTAASLAEGLQRVANRLRRYIDFDTFAVLLLDDLGRELHFEFALGFAPEVEKHWRFGLGQGIVGTVAQTREPLRIGDVHQDNRYIHASDQVRSEMAQGLAEASRRFSDSDEANNDLTVLVLKVTGG